jgi:hypothetical protein
VDADPQCNATQIVLGDELIERTYAEQSSSQKTLYTYLRPIEEGEPSIDINTEPVLGTANRFQTDLIPGHPRMSIVEDRLSDACRVFEVVISVDFGSLIGVRIC